MTTWTFWWTRLLHMFMIDSSIFGTAKADPGPSQRGDLRAIRDPRLWHQFKLAYRLLVRSFWLSSEGTLHVFFLWISRHANYIGFNLWTVVAHIAGHKAANQSTICEPHQENGRNGFQDPPTMLRIQHFPNTFSPKKEGTCFWLKEYPEGTESHCGDEGPVCSWEGAGVYSPV